jgi:hypothetical protein
MTVQAIPFITTHNCVHVLCTVWGMQALWITVATSALLAAPKIFFLWTRLLPHTGQLRIFLQKWAGVLILSWWRQENIDGSLWLLKKAKRQRPGGLKSSQHMPMDHCEWHLTVDHNWITPQRAPPSNKSAIWRSHWKSMQCADSGLQVNYYQVNIP